LPYSYNKLRGRIIERYGSQEAFSKVVGISPTSLSLKMTGQTGFSQSDIKTWSEHLEIKTDEIGDYFFA